MYGVCQLCCVLVLAFWGAALYYFQLGATDWSVSPAKARANNNECMLGGFFDPHDLWHCLSAYGELAWLSIVGGKLMFAGVVDRVVFWCRHAADAGR